MSRCGARLLSEKHLAALAIRSSASASHELLEASLWNATARGCAASAALVIRSVMPPPPPLQS
eukprot:10959839-Alexandrium_andersonii.AAC.1